MLVEFLCTVLFLCVIWHILQKSRSKNEPPGPYQFPILGSLPQVGMADPRPYMAFHKLSVKYGPVVTVKMGLGKAVLVSSHEAIKEILAKEECAGREAEGIWNERNWHQNIGLAFSNGENWRQIRQFTIRTLQEFGQGRDTAMETIIAEVVEGLSKKMKSLIKENNGIVKFHMLFTLSELNVLWRLVGGTKLENSSAKAAYILETSNRFMKTGVFGMGLIMAFPFLRYLAPKITGYALQKEIVHEWQDFFTEVVRAYKKRYDETKEVSCFIDSFLKKMEESVNDPNTVFTEKQCIVTLLDIFQAAAETTGNYLEFVFLFIFVYPEIQKKMQDELDEVLGKDVAKLSDQDRLPYINAVVLEVMRWARVVVNSVPRRVMKDFVYKQWTIKKDSLIVPNFHAVHFDEEFWKDPNVFRPERFLDENGDIIKEKADRLTVFGSGKRVCPGETIGRDSIFLYTTILLQRFTFALVPGDEIPSTEPVVGFVMSPVPYRAVVKCRSGY